MRNLNITSLIEHVSKRDLRAVVCRAIAVIALVNIAVCSDVEGKELRRIGTQVRSTRHQAAATSGDTYTHGPLPIAFEPNMGQTDASVKYIAKAGNYTVFFTSAAAVFVLPDKVPFSGRPPSGRATLAATTRPTASWSSIQMKVQGGNPEPLLEAGPRLPGKKNYFIGRDRTKWVQGVPLYSEIAYHAVYSGIDINYHDNGKRCEFDFLVKPGADPNQIRLQFTGQQQLTSNSAGDVILSSTGGDLNLHRPLAYQLLPSGVRRPVKARFVARGQNTVGISVGRYDHRHPLVVDPSVTYATYLGGVGLDEGLSVATDGLGNTFVTGGTASPDFPNTGGGLPYSGGLDVFVTAFDPNGQLIFSTLVGGTLDDVGTSIAVSASGSSQGIYVAGYSTSPDFPAFGYQYYLAGVQNAIIVKLDYTTGSGPTASTYLGGEAVDSGLGITFDAQGYIFVAGQTTSQYFPISSPLFNGTQLNMGTGSGASDGFVTEFVPDLSELYFSTYLGGSQQDFISAIAIDNPDSPTRTYNLYLTGGTDSPDFYTTPGVVQPTCGTDGNCNNGEDDAFVTVICDYSEAPCGNVGLNPNYVYSTFLGGSGKEDASGIAADSSGNAYITGGTTSADFPTANPLQATLKGSQNAFVSKLDPTGTAPLVFSTYLGGSGSDDALGLTIDASDNVYVTGKTTSPNFPVRYPTQGTPGGRSDAFVSSMDPLGASLMFSTYLGGSGDEDQLGGSIAVDASQYVYVTGDTNSSDFPVVSAYQGTFAGSGNCTINGQQVTCPDAFVAKINAQPPGSSGLNISFGTDGGDGLITSSPGGIDCSSTGSPGECSASFINGTVVTLSETAINSNFNGWGGDGSSCGTNPTCQITVASPGKNVTVDFIPILVTYNLLVAGVGVGGAPAGTGTITSSPTGIDCGLVCSFNFAPGTPVTLTATPDSNSYFYGWSGNAACTGTGPCTVVMSSNQSLNYTFLANGAPPPQPDFQMTLSPVTLGTVSIGSQGVAGITVATLNGFSGTVNLSCAVQPFSSSAPSCSVTPSSFDLQANQGGSATLTVNTTGLVASRRQTLRKQQQKAALAVWLPLFCLSVLSIGSGRPQRRRVLRALFFAAVAILVVGFEIACSSSGSNSGSQGGVAQAGNYTITVSGQSDTPTITHSVQLSMTVQ